MKDKLKLLIFIFIQGWTLQPGLSAAKPPVSQSGNKTMPVTFTPNNASLWYEFNFHVSVSIPYDPKLKDQSSELYKTKYDTFCTKITDAYKTSPGFNLIRNIKFLETSFITCAYTAVYSATTNLAVIKEDLMTQVIRKLKGEAFWLKGTVINFDPNETEMTFIITQFAGGQGQRITCNSVVSPCPREYVCVDMPYFICKHRCQYGNETLSCNNGGQCFVDIATNRTKCSCPSTDSYLYSGPLCDEKVDKLALKLTYIIVIAAGGGGGIILIMAIIIVVLCVRGRTHGMKGDQQTEEAVYLDTFNQPDGRDGRGPTRESTLILDGVSNELYSGSTDIKFLEGRSHTVLKDNRGQEIYVYKPIGQRKSPSRLSSTDVDSVTARPVSFHGNGISNNVKVECTNIEIQN